MKFSEVILESRYRLNDIRKKDSTVISDPLQDGIRWSSVQLVSIAKSAGKSLLRTLATFKSQNVNEGYLHQIMGCTIAHDSGYITELTGIRFTEVISLQTIDLTKTYRYISPKEFSAKKRMVTEGGGIDDAVFTYLYKDLGTTAGKQIIVPTLPIPVADVSAEVIMKIYNESLFTLASTDELPFVEVDDIYLDFIELEARRREHNTAMAKDIVENIKLSLTLLGDTK